MLLTHISQISPSHRPQHPSVLREPHSRGSHRVPSEHAQWSLAVPGGRRPGRGHQNRKAMGVRTDLRPARGLTIPADGATGSVAPLCRLGNRGKKRPAPGTPLPQGPPPGPGGTHRPGTQTPAGASGGRRAAVPIPGPGARGNPGPPRAEGGERALDHRTRPCRSGARGHHPARTSSARRHWAERRVVSPRAAQHPERGHCTWVSIPT